MTHSGIGFDAHVFDPSRPLVLGGIAIPDSPGLAGHSDADVLSHAIADALLGAANAGDLGIMFPADEANEGISSLTILGRVAEELGAKGWRIENVDATVIAERPRLADHREDIIGSLASALDLPAEAISVKATSTDGMGFTGRGDGIAALAVAAVERVANDSGNSTR